MPSVDFVYDKDCPNVNAARANLMRAFSRAGIEARWQEHQIGSAQVPAHARGFGSPTVLVDGVDVEGLSAGAEDCCRVYASGGVPDVALITAAIVRATKGEDRSGQATGAPPTRSGWKVTAAALPGIGVAFLPKVVCPFCWPAYAGVLGAMGLTFLMEDRWLLPISAVLLLATLGVLAWRAPRRRGYRPLGLGAVSAAAILLGKFAFDSAPTVYAAITVLVAACVWNAWPRRRVEPSCPACPPSTQGEVS